MIKAPWTDAQVAALARWQADDRVHPFTCGGSHGSTTLIPTPEGWICPLCDYKQNWAHDFMFTEEAL